MENINAHIDCYFWINNREKTSIEESVKKLLPPEVNIKDDIDIKNIQLFLSNQEKKIIILPLFEIEPENHNIIPTGLYNIFTIFKEYRSKEYNHLNFHTIFLVSNKIDIPFIFQPEKEMPSYVQKIIRNPEFGWIEKAILMAELIYVDNNGQKDIINILDVLDEHFQDNLKNAIKRLSEIEVPYQYREKYYDTFIDFYNPLMKKNREKSNFDNWLNYFKEKYTIDEFIDISNCCQYLKLREDMEGYIDKSQKLYAAFKFANEAYNCLNGITTEQEGTHRMPLDLFSAPVPFTLQELIDARNEIDEATNKEIKLLLIDNKTYKFRNKNKMTLPELLSNFSIDNCFKIEMLGGKPPDDTFNEEFEAFNFRRFSSDEESKLGSEEKTYHSDFIKAKKMDDENLTYTELVYEKIKSSHFILLDFFLNKENTYLAFNFIKEISEIKQKNGDYSSTWYFITSAFYDSVVKYSQSGLLSEYYESAVVNAGDDPTNDKRQIIFVYKLLTFIDSRIKHFVTYKKRIYDMMLNKEKDEKGDISCNIYIKKNCKNNKCLKDMQTNIKRYLTEYDNIYSIFYEPERKEDYKNIAQLLDNVIRQFLWLPQADWYKIQMQIDVLNNKIAKLERDDKNRSFSCSYILDELKKRSDIY